MEQNRWPLRCRFRTGLKDNPARLQLIALVYNVRNFLRPADLEDLVGTHARAREEATAADHPSRFDRAGADAAHRFETPVPRVPLLPRVEPGLKCCQPGRVRRWRYRHPLPSELHVKVSLHAAQAFTNAPRRTRPLLSVVLAHGSADDSWHATTPSCRPCQDRLGCARCDGGSCKSSSAIRSG